MKKYLWLFLLAGWIAVAVAASIRAAASWRSDSAAETRGTGAEASLSQRPATAQAAPASGPQQAWSSDVERDPITGRAKTVWTLFGTYLLPPSDPKEWPPVLSRSGRVVLGTVIDSPAIYLACRGGRLLSAYVDSGAVVLDQDAAENVAAEYRLDHGRVRRAKWAISTNYRAAFFDAATAGRMLRAKTVLVGLPEFGAGEIEIRFAQTDAAAPAKSCGLAR